MPIPGIVASSISGSKAITGNYYSIATITATSGSISNFDFTSIPQTYTHLQLRILGQSSGAVAIDNLAMYFNNDTGSNYNTHYLSGNGATVAAGAFTSLGNFYIPSLFSGSSSGQFTGVVIDILDYTNTSKYKTVRTLSGFDANGSGSVTLCSASWQSTAAISRFTGATSFSISQYSSFALYGVK